ncbi:unnamed protein product [Amoebophrya sp. A120]|nr:unnamed protein product [Amoebophrya sp. A120]|eukprot:GSA120T00010035001.1
MPSSAAPDEEPEVISISSASSDFEVLSNTSDANDELLEELERLAVLPKTVVQKLRQMSSRWYQQPILSFLRELQDKIERNLEDHVFALHYDQVGTDHFVLQYSAKEDLVVQQLSQAAASRKINGATTKSMDLVQSGFELLLDQVKSQMKATRLREGDDEGEGPWDHMLSRSPSAEVEGGEESQSLQKWEVIAVEPSSSASFEVILYREQDNFSSYNGGAPEFLLAKLQLVFLEDEKHAKMVEQIQAIPDHKRHSAEYFLQNPAVDFTSGRNHMQFGQRVKPTPKRVSCPAQNKRYQLTAVKLELQWELGALMIPGKSKGVSGQHLFDKAEYLQRREKIQNKRGGLKKGQELNYPAADDGMFWSDAFTASFVVTPTTSTRADSSSDKVVRPTFVAHQHRTASDLMQIFSKKGKTEQQYRY